MRHGRQESRTGLAGRLSGCLLGAGLLLLSLGSPAAAHPHVWIDSKTTLLFDAEQRVAALEIVWRFDEFYSIYAIEGLDKNDDGVLEPAELQPLAKLNVTSLKDYRYFTYVRANGRDTAYGEVVDYGSRFEDGILSLRFVLPLKEPVDPRLAQLSFTSFDPSFYISIEPQPEAPVVLSGAVPEGCRVLLDRGDETESLNLAESLFVDATAADSIAAEFASRAALDCATSTGMR